MAWSSVLMNSPKNIPRHVLDTIYKPNREAVFIIDPLSLTIRACNRAAECLFDYPARELVGASAAMLCADSKYKDDFSLAIPRVRQGSVVTMSGTMRRQDAGTFFARSRITAVETRAESSLVMWIVRDANESLMPYSTEILDRDLLRIGATEPDLRRREDAILSRLSQEFQWEYAETWVAGAQRLTHGRWWAVSGARELQRFAGISQSIEFARGESLSGRVWESGESEWLNDAGEKPCKVFGRTFMASSAGLRTFFASPVLQGGRVTHILVFASKAPRDEQSEIAAMIKDAIHALSSFLTPCAHDSVPG